MLEERLKKANIYLNADKQNYPKVRDYFWGPGANYSLLATSCLDLTYHQGKRFKEPLFLDDINGWYETEKGQKEYSKKGGSLHSEELKAALIKHWNQRYSSNVASSLDEIVETIP